MEKKIKKERLDKKIKRTNYAAAAADSPTGTGTVPGAAQVLVCKNSNYSLFTLFWMNVHYCNEELMQLKTNPAKSNACFAPQTFS